jgi:hypothetical protein
MCGHGRGRLCDAQRVAAHATAARHAAAEHVVPVGLAGQPIVVGRTTVVVRQRAVFVRRTAGIQRAAVVHGDIGVGIIRRVRVVFRAVSGRTGAATLANAALTDVGPTRGTDPGASRRRIPGTARRITCRTGRWHAGPAGQRRKQRQRRAGWQAGRCSGQRGRIQRGSGFCRPAGRRRRGGSSDRRGSPRADRPSLRRDVRRVR